MTSTIKNPSAYRLAKQTEWARLTSEERLERCKIMSKSQYLAFKDFMSAEEEAVYKRNREIIPNKHYWLFGAFLLGIPILILTNYAGLWGNPSYNSTRCTAAQMTRLTLDMDNSGRASYDSASRIKKAEKEACN
jgi:hypothetical protein